MKYFKILIIITVVASLAYAPEALAVKRAPFDSSALQPMPIPDAHPNVSASVSSNPITNKEIKVETVPLNQETQNSNQNNPAPSQNNFLYILIWVTVSILVVVLIALSFIFLKPKKLK